MIGISMASPIGHAIAGVLVAWSADVFNPAGPGSRATKTGFHVLVGGLTLAAAVLAAAPDLDLLFIRFHRTATHSLLSVAVVAGVAMLAAARLRRPVIRTAIVCAAAWGSHMLLDWLSVDRSTPNGIQILWPFDSTWFISGWDVFPGTERRRLFSRATIATNAAAVAAELIILAPLAAALGLVRVKSAARFASKIARGDHAAK
jgi:membrane-bound metal-dependent hydrolase YbcI (DUF457 family)